MSIKINLYSFLEISILKLKKTLIINNKEIKNISVIFPEMRSLNVLNALLKFKEKMLEAALIIAEFGKRLLK